MKPPFRRYGLLVWAMLIAYLLIGITTGILGYHTYSRDKPIEYKQTVINNTPNKVYKMRVTAYQNKSNRKSALNDTIHAGKTAAVSPACIDLLGEKVYIEGHGIRYVNDLTAKWLDEKFDVCTIDLAVGSHKELEKIGNRIQTVILLNK